MHRTAPYPAARAGSYDLLIVGAGPVGCVIAERAAALRGWTSLIIDKRPHIAGNCFDPIHESGLRMHRYGPHYFRTNCEKLLAYLSKFTEWIDGKYVVMTSTHGKLHHFPISLLTLESFFNRSFTELEARDFIESVREDIPCPSNSEEYVLSRVGRELYEAFYYGYTKKQWGRPARELDVSVCGRLPVRMNRDLRYVDHKYQVTPKEGFNSLFLKMISHPLISLRLNTDFNEVRSDIRPTRATVYCGPIDEYFDYQLGKLPWRSLSFEFKELTQEWAQPCVQINYPNDFQYTRSVEIKHITEQKHPHTLLSFEYPMSQGDPYYPIPSPASRLLYEKYQELAKHETKKRKVFFCGRLAEYKYLNTDEAIERALVTFDSISHLHPSQYFKDVTLQL